MDKTARVYSNSDLMGEVVISNDPDSQPVDVFDLVFYSGKMSSAEICAALDRLKMAILQSLVRR